MSLKKYKTKVLHNSYQLDENKNRNIDKDSPLKNYFLCAFLAQRNSGKTNALVSILEQTGGCIKDGKNRMFENVLLVCPTYHNQELYKSNHFSLPDTNVFTELDDSVLEEIFTIIDEKNTRYEHDKHVIDTLEELVKNKMTVTDLKNFLDDIMIDEEEDTLKNSLLFELISGNKFNPEEHIAKIKNSDGYMKYEPRHLIIFDDCGGYKALRSKTLERFFIKHRHMRTSMVVCIQHSKQIPPSLRANMSLMCIFNTKNEENMKQIKSDFLSFLDDKDYSYILKIIGEPFNFISINYDEKGVKPLYPLIREGFHKKIMFE